MYIAYKEGEKHPPRNAEISEDLDVFEDAGYILEEQDLVVDIDNIPHDTIKALIKTFNINTQVTWTDRGAHLFFKKPEGFRGAKGMCPLGIEVEYKHMSNTKSITVKRNGIARKMERVGIREEFPDFFKKGTYEPLLGLADGDGRNQKLFAHRKKLGAMKNWLLIVDFINQHIFSEPLPDKEFKEITRDMEITAVKDGESLIADAIMREKRVVMYSGSLYFYENEEYINDEFRLERMVYRYCEGQKTRYVNEVIDQMKMRSKLIDPEKEFDIKFKNGLLKDGEFLEIDYTDFTPYSININYYPDAEPVKEVDDYLDQLTENDPDYKARLLESLGHTLVTNKEFNRLLGKFFIFVGDGGNGKGTLLTIIRKILNEKNCTSLSISNMTDERYLNVMKGKLANLGDDIQDQPINQDQMKMLKNISTSDNIELRKLYESSKSTSMSTTLIFTSNHVLKSFEKGFSYKRRVDWMPMYTKPKKKDPLFITRLTTEKALEYWIRLIIEAYFRLYKNGKFTESEKVYNFNEEYHEENNTALGYIRDLSKEDIIGKRSPEVYDPYVTWCEENGVSDQSNRQFKETVKEIHRLIIKPVKINGKTARVYTEMTEGEQLDDEDE